MVNANGSYPAAQSVDLLGTSEPASSYSTPTPETFTPGAAGGRTVDLSGAGSAFSTARPTAAASAAASSGYSANGRGNSFAPSGFSSANGRGSYANSPQSFEGGGPSLSLSGLSPANLARQLASRPVTEIVAEQGRNLMQLPRIAARAYSAAAKRYLRPWNEFVSINPARVVDGFRQASRRGEIQIHLQRNVLSNARQFCPNYMFMFLATLFMFVCTSPMLLGMLACVGGGWAHALHNEEFRSRPWMLQIGGMQVPLGSNLKMAIMSLPTLLFLHFFMGPVLWSAALCSGGVSLAHAAIRDRSDDADPDDHGSGGRIRELP
mmetsp:Transcript_38086/g.89198  ORF Transcript_38086/g.89198 Transcript_38086/m.89198 type:complete len:321 (-) Transcript_38086:134-1096(-)